jgi:hypothetical protein
MESRRHLRHAFAATTLACGLLGLAGCTSRTDLGATGAAPADVAHLWVTVEEVWFATSADTAADSSAGWNREKLPAPVVLDLASLDAGTLVPLTTGLSLPAGRYRQLHLVIADAGDQLLDEADALGLDYNAQVDVECDTGSITRAPLELPVPRAGLTIPIDFTFEDTGRTDDDGEEVASLALTIDAARDVLGYEYGSNKGYILSPSASVDDAAAAGEIRGRVDASGLATGHPAVTASAQVLDDSGTHRRILQRRLVAADGTFSLYPLPAGDDGTTYDVVIAGAGTRTVLIRDVPVEAGAAPVSLQAEPIALTPETTVHADVDGALAGLPAGTRVEFFRTLPGSDERPFLVDGTALDPVTLSLPGGAFALAPGPVTVGTYAGGEPIVFDTVTPSERDGGYLVGSAGPYRSDTLAAAPVLVTGSSSRPTLLDVPVPDFAAGGRAGRLTIGLQAPVGRYDRGFVAVMTGHRLVETVRVDELLARGGGTVLVEGLPSGSALARAAGVSYRAALRAWNSRNAAGTIQRVAAPGSASLGDGGEGTLQLEVQ